MQATKNIQSLRMFGMSTIISIFFLEEQCTFRILFIRQLKTYYKYMFLLTVKLQNSYYKLPF